MESIRVRVFDKYINKFIEHGQKDKTVKKCFGFTSRNEMILLQDQFLFVPYTGVNDKNGTEIYDGDVVWDGKNKYIVSRYLSGYILDKAKKVAYQPNNTIWLSDYYYCIEVVGSIYDKSDIKEKVKCY
ncbi:YopX family protein [Oceanobacillus oncorhynchi]|uniref:YopX family protein n=1 Tax=Oceanobacillus oncorhynchi TaxID=545501 RepID=UPI0034D61C90